MRVDFYESLDNSAMFWQVQSIQAFHSIVPGSLMEFYDSIGVQRDVAPARIRRITACAR